MLSMDGGGRSRGRKLKDGLARLLRPANSLLRSPCSSSSTSTFTATTAATTTISSSSSTTGAAAVLPGVVEPFSAALDLLRHPPPRPEHRKKTSTKQRCCSGRRCHFGDVRTLSSNPYGFTTSDDGEGTDGDDEYDDDDTEAFFSPRSAMSSDSSTGFYTSKQQPCPIPKGGKNHHHPHRSRRNRLQPTARRLRRRPEQVGICEVREDQEAAAGFRPVVTSASEEVRKGLAVVRRSRDPYGDFRESMAEMIVERQVFGEAELERLLQSYLSLNAARLHPVILQAFSDIWVVLHGG